MAAVLGTLTTAQVITLIAALIGQTGTLVKVLEDLHAFNSTTLPPEHAQTVQAAAQALIQAINAALPIPLKVP